MNPRSPKALQSRIGLAALLPFVVLLIAPVLALIRLASSLQGWFMASIGGFLIVLSVTTWALYGHDKQKAQAGAWRVPESTLHLMELLGGWPGAYLAQRYFRHKISKVGYQLVYGAIVLVHQYAAIDFLFDGRMTRSVMAWA